MNSGSVHGRLGVEFEVSHRNVNVLIMRYTKLGVARAVTGMKNKYRFFWTESDTGISGVGRGMFADKWVEKRV